LYIQTGTSTGSRKIIFVTEGAEDLNLFNGLATFTAKIETTSTATDSIKTAGGVRISGNDLDVGAIFTISCHESDPKIISVDESLYWIYKDNLKWFATKEEAEEFSNVLTGKVDAFGRVRVVDTEVAKIPKYVAGQRGTMEAFDYTPKDWIDFHGQQLREQMQRDAENVYLKYVHPADMQGAVIIPPPNWSIVPLDEYPITEKECKKPLKVYNPDEEDVILFPTFVKTKTLDLKVYKSEE
jgi:hypothetical protein